MKPFVSISRINNVITNNINKLGGNQVNNFFKRSLSLMLLLILGLWLIGCTNDDEHYTDIDEEQQLEEEQQDIEAQDSNAIIEDAELIPVDDVVADLQLRFASEAGYDFTEPLIDLPRDHMFRFDMTYEVMEIFREVVANSDDPDAGWENMVRIYRDSALTQQVSFSVDGDEENFTYVTFSPSRNPTFPLLDSAIGGNIFDHGEFNDWGNARQYFLVKYYDLHTGEQLERPQVTVFNIATEIPGAPRVKFNITEDGIAGLRWEEVASADEYAVVLVTENQDGRGIGRQVEIIARTSETYWDDIATDPRENNRNFRTATGNTGYPNNVDNLYQEYREQIFEGEMTPEEFAELAADFNFEFVPHREQNTYFAIIAMNDEGNSAISNLINRREISSQVPLDVAFWLNFGEDGQGIRPTFDGTNSMARFDHDIMLAPSHVWVNMADGNASLHLVNYEIESVREGTLLYGTYTEYDEDGWPIIDDTIDVPAITVQYFIEGTDFRGFIQITEYDEDTFEDDLQELALRQDELRSRTGDLTITVDLNPEFLDDAFDDNIDEDDSATEDNESENDQVATGLRNDFEIRNPSSALTAFLAIQMLNSQERISLEKFPEASDQEYLVEAWFEAVLQNPLILGPRSMQLDWATGDILITYDHDAQTQQRQQRAIMERVAEIVDEIIESGMTDLEKQTAINEFLIEHATYDFGALDNAEQNNFMFVDPEYYDAFTAYGILINGIGVCSGYADAFTLIADEAGLESVIVTGYLQGSLPHAWNRVNIDGQWYTLDVTNNDNELFPNAFFNLSDLEAATILTEDSRWMLDRYISNYIASSVADTEYYRFNDRFFDQEEIVEALVDGITYNGRATYRTNVLLTEEQFLMIALEVMEQTGNFDLMGGQFLGVITIFEE